MNNLKKIITYFTPAEYIIIVLSGIAADLSLRYYPLLIDYPKIVDWFHEVLNLPSPGGGIFLPGGIYLFWAYLARGLVEKKGCIFLMTVVMLMVIAILSPTLGGKNTLWNIGWIIISIACEVFSVLFKEMKVPGRAIATALLVLTATSLIQVVTGVKIWEKSSVWPGAVPVFIAAGFILALIMLITIPPPDIIAGMLSITVYIAFLWLTVFFPPFKPPVGYPFILVSVNVSAAIAILIAMNLSKLMQMLLKNKE